MNINVKVNCLRLDLKNNVIDLLDSNINVLKTIEIKNKTTLINDKESYNCMVFYHDKIDFIINLVKKGGFFAVERDNTDFLKEKNLKIQELVFYEDRKKLTRHLLDYVILDTEYSIYNKVNAFIVEV